MVKCILAIFHNISIFQITMLFPFSVSIFIFIYLPTQDVLLISYAKQIALYSKSILISNSILALTSIIQRQIAFQILDLEAKLVFLS